VCFRDSNEGSGRGPHRNAKTLDILVVPYDMRGALAGASHATCWGRDPTPCVGEDQCLVSISDSGTRQSLLRLRTNPARLPIPRLASHPLRGPLYYNRVNFEARKVPDVLRVF